MKELPKRSKRKYARFFDWHNKPRKELGILEELLETMKLRQDGTYHSPENALNDPPDCTLLDTENRIIAVEITEFVSEEAVSDAEQGKLA